MWRFSDLAATVTLHSESIRLCIWTPHAACRLSSDPATHWTVCVRGEKEGGQGVEKEGERGWDEDEENERRVCRRRDWGQSETGRCNALSKTIWGIKTVGLSIRKICRDKAELDGRVWVKASQSEGSREKKGGSVGEEMKDGEMVTHSSGGKALIYSLCLFWVIYCGCMRVSISTWPLGAEA